jgi:chaperonin GroES
MLNLDNSIVLSEDVIKAPSLLDRFTTDDHHRIANHIWAGFERDRASRSQWDRRTNAAMDLALQVQQAKTFPWPGASNVVFPLVTIAALQFSARAYANLIQGTDIVRYRVIGQPTDDVTERAERIGRHMSWQCLEEDISWEEQHDRLFINLAIVGCNFPKTYYDASRRCVVTDLVMARDFYIDYWAKSVEQAARKTHRFPLYKNEIYERVQQGLYADVLDEPWFMGPPPTVQVNPQVDKRKGQTPPASDQDAAHIALEQHCWLDLDGDGYEEPYIATIEETSKELLRLTARVDSMEQVRRRNGKIESIQATEYFTKYSFIPSPDNGIYDLGFGTFLGPINESVNSGINQLLDNGTMQNSIGGFLGRGAKIRGGTYTMAPFQWVRVDSTGDDLKKNIVPFEERQPSEVMFKLIGLLIEYAERVAGTTDAVSGENPGQNTPATTYQGMTEHGLQMFGMIYKRVWRCMKEEFRKRYELNGKYLASTERFGPSNDFIRREDYTGSPDQIAPVADPNVTSTTMRLQQAMAVMDIAMKVPGFSLPDAVKGYLKAIRVEQIDKIYPGPDKVPPLPNPKAALEELKLQGKKMELDTKKQEWANKLLEERRLNNAKIMQLQAQAYSLVKQADAAAVEHQLTALQMVIDHLQAHGELLNERIGMLMGDSNGGNGGSSKDSQTDDGSGVSGMAGAAGNGSVQSLPTSQSSGASGAVGGGSVSV